jgi:hypothetical protein
MGWVLIYYFPVLRNTRMKDILASEWKMFSPAFTAPPEIPSVPTLQQVRAELAERIRRKGMYSSSNSNRILSDGCCNYQT